MSNSAAANRDHSLTLRPGHAPAAAAALLGIYGLIWGAAAAWGLQARPEAMLASILLAALLIVLSVVDLVRLRLPDGLTLLLALLGLLITFALQGWMAALAHFAAGVAGLLLLLGVARLYRGARGREGLGMGDAKLFAAGGAWVGPEGLCLVLLVASVLMLAAIAVALVLGARLPAGMRLPFGPALAAALWCVWQIGGFP